MIRSTRPPPDRNGAVYFETLEDGRVRKIFPRRQRQAAEAAKEQASKFKEGKKK